MNFKVKMFFICLVTLTGMNAWADISPENILVNVEKNGKWIYEVADVKNDGDAALLYGIVNEAIRSAPESVSIKTPNGDVTVDLKAIIGQLSYVVNHGHRFTKMYSGWGPEDDFEYEYPNQSFYHPTKNPKGKIKINLTEKAMQIVRLGAELGAKNKDIYDGAHIYSTSLILHEALHAAQYSVYPVRSFSDAPKSIADGLLVDTSILDGTKLKLGYEVQAMQRDFLIQKDLGVDKKQKFLEAAIKYLKDDSNAGTVNAKYGLIKLTHLQGYLADCNEVKKLQQRSVSDLNVFANEANDVIYNSEYKPVEAVYDLHNINQNIKRGRITKTPAVISEVVELKKTWKRYMECTLAGVNVLGSWTYLPAVKARYERELAMFDSYK